MSSTFNIPAGFALVPLEPTEDMKRAANSAYQRDVMATAADLYRAMLSAAPPVDAVPGEKIDELVALIAGSETDFDRGIPRFQVIRSKVRDWLDTNLAASVASRAGSEPVKWGYAKTVGNAIAQLQTMDASLPFYAALHLQDGRCIARGVTFSRERVVNERWIDNRNKDVPYSIVVWSQPVESLHTTAPIAPAAAAEPSEPAHSYALGLATTLWTRYYKAHAPNWQPLEDTLGLLTQIDNMIAGLLPDRERAASLGVGEGWTIIAPDGWKFTGEKPMNLILEASRHEREIDPVEADRQDMRLMAAIDEEMAEHKRDRAELVSRFLRWPLPKTVFTDAGTGTVEPSKRPENWSASGTNLLTAEEATAMLAFVLDCDEGDRELAQREVDRASAGEAQS